MPTQLSLIYPRSSTMQDQKRFYNALLPIKKDVIRQNEIWVDLKKFNKNIFPLIDNKPTIILNPFSSPNPSSEEIEGFKKLTSACSGIAVVHFCQSAGEVQAEQLHWDPVFQQFRSEKSNKPYAVIYLANDDRSLNENQKEFLEKVLASQEVAKTVEKSVSIQQNNLENFKKPTLDGHLKRVALSFFSIVASMAWIGVQILFGEGFDPQKNFSEFWGTF